MTTAIRLIGLLYWMSVSICFLQYVGEDPEVTKELERVADAVFALLGR